MTHGSLFSGIGGFDLAAEWMGWENIFHCEWNPFGQKVLKHHFPNSISYNDITKTDFTIHRGEIDILTGGFPCQPYSLAGKRKGKEDDRHLWPEMLRAIREIQPSWVVGENVFGLVNWSDGLVFHEVQTDLEAAGYEIFPYVLPACAVNAPHRRDRIWFVAYNNSFIRGEGWHVKSSKQPRHRESILQNAANGSIAYSDTKQREWSERGFQPEPFNGSAEITPNPYSNGQHRGNSEYEVNASERGEYAQRDIKSVGGNVTNPDSIGQEWGLYQDRREPSIYNKFGKLYSWFRKWDSWQNFPTQSPIRSGDDGLPPELDGITFSKWRNESIKASGNAIVPQVALQIFKAIQEYEN